MFLDMIDGKFGMGQSRGETRHGKPSIFVNGPVAPPGQTAGEDTHIIDVIGDREWHGTQIVERRRGPERRDHPLVRRRR